MKSIMAAIAISGCGWACMALADEPAATTMDDRFVLQAATWDSTERELGHMAAELDTCGSEGIFTPGYP